MDHDDAALTLRARCVPRFARVVRTMVAACAALEEFSVDRIADVRLLADELFIAACAVGAQEAVFRVTPDQGDVALAMTAALPAGAGAAAEGVRFARTCADVIAPGSELSVDGGELAFRALLSSEPS